ncbi:Uncharacterised protein [Mycobacteroides abscessus subsp. abscessus]|nr:Uncharacterised protein [Mycobacteroides abscessus subsp. abscessus]
MTATGYLVVNQPTVRDRSTLSARSSCRPWPSTSMPMVRAPSANSAIAKANPMSRTSLMPAWNAAGASRSSVCTVSTSSSVTESCPAVSKVSRSG